MIHAARQAFEEHMESFLKGEQEKPLLKISKAEKLRETMKSFSFTHGYTHKSVLALELEGFNTIHGLMSMLWFSIDIMAGKYLKPQEEERILLFVDLRNSTPIAEKLGHEGYFEFIRDFIFCITAGVMEQDGRIYQYVGDEIVAWWPSSKENARKAINSLIQSRKVINANTEIFKRNYDILPEYKAGLHTGSVMVGQVGISKKELVMSGDTINTASRIRSACNDLNQKFLVSKELMELAGLEDWQTESMGEVDLKGKNQNIELFALKI